MSIASKGFSTSKRKHITRHTKKGFQWNSDQQGIHYSFEVITTLSVSNSLRVSTPQKLKMEGRSTPRKASTPRRIIRSSEENAKTPPVSTRLQYLLRIYSFSSSKVSADDIIESAQKASSSTESEDNLPNPEEVSIGYLGFKSRSYCSSLSAIIVKIALHEILVCYHSQCF